MRELSIVGKKWNNIVYKPLMWHLRQLGPHPPRLIVQSLAYMMVNKKREYRAVKS